MDHLELIPVVKSLEAHRISYALGGSGMLAYLRLTDTVHDWDLMVECPKSKLIEAIQGYEWIELSCGGYPFASQYRISIPSLYIEFIGYFALRTENGIVRLPVRSLAKWDGIRISDPEIWYVAYRLMNRESKASLLRDYLQRRIIGK